MRALAGVNVMDFASGYGLRRNLCDIILDWMMFCTGIATRGSMMRRRKLYLRADLDWLTPLRQDGQADKYAGIDIAGNALAYGKAVGIYDAEFAENLQDNAPSDGLADWLTQCDLVVECGSVAHMLPGAFGACVEGHGGARGLGGDGPNSRQ